MRRLALLTALAMAASPAAMASPDVPYPNDYERRGDVYNPADNRAYDDRKYDDRYGRNDRYQGDDDRYRDNDRYRDRYRRDARGRWVPLARYSRADTGRQLIYVDGRTGRVDKLWFEAARGAPVIRRVVVEYMDRGREVYRVNAQLPRGTGQVIDLPGNRRISKIVVITDPRSRGVYSVYGG